jgi:hypothetical protein
MVYMEKEACPEKKDFLRKNIWGRSMSQHISASTNHRKTRQRLNQSQTR